MGAPLNLLLVLLSADVMRWKFLDLLEFSPVSRISLLHIAIFLPNNVVTDMLLNGLVYAQMSLIVLFLQEIFTQQIKKTRKVLVSFIFEIRM